MLPVARDGIAQMTRLCIMESLSEPSPETIDFLTQI